MSNKYYEKKDAEELIKSFLNSQFPGKKIEDQINELRFFSFWEIKEKDKYRNNKNYADGDCTNLAYAIAWCLFGKTLKEFESEDYSFLDLLDEKDFSGDTICTWNTLFNDPRVLLEIEFSEEEKKEITRFYELYQSIGNFYLLPNIKVGRTSLNTYRGNYYGLKDYFDLFRELLKSHGDLEIENLVKENKFFFGDCTNNWEKLRDIFFLESTEQLNFTETHFNHSQYRKEIKGEYKRFVLDYVRQSTSMIEKRSEILVDNLKEVFKEN